MSDTDWKGVAYELGWMACGSPASERFDEIVAKHPWVGPTEAQRIQELEAQCAAMREAICLVLGKGHALKAFAGTMLRWNEPGADFTDEARRIVRLADEFHTALVAALATDAGKAMLEELRTLREHGCKGSQNVDR